MSSCEWVVALPLGRRGRHRRGDDAGVYTNRWKWPLGSVSGRLCTLLRLARIVRTAVGTQECTQIGQNGLSAPFWGICVHCCDASCNASRNTNRDASCVRWHECLNHHGVPAAPPRWPLSLGREDRLCASGAAARLASSPRHQPTRTPEEPNIECHFVYDPDISNRHLVSTGSCRNEGGTWSQSLEGRCTTVCSNGSSVTTEPLQRSWTAHGVWARAPSASGLPSASTARTCWSTSRTFQVAFAIYSSRTQETLTSSFSSSLQSMARHCTSASPW